MPASIQDIAAQVVNSIAAGASSSSRPVLFDQHGRPLPPSASYSYRRSAAKQAGSMKNWIPQRLLSRQEEALERERIVVRSIDLTNSDPHAAGIVDTFATTVIGSGLIPHALINYKMLGIGKEEARSIKEQQASIYQIWSPYADCGQRMNFGAIQFLCERNLMQYGEYLVLVRWLDDPLRPYSLALQVINPMRLRTPIDMINRANIRDGIELGRDNEPIAYWVKKSDAANPFRYVLDTSSNFVRIPARFGHRPNVLHGFICQDAEQVRGIPLFAPAMKFFRDIHDLLDAELVSSIVTAALSYFIELPGGTDPFGVADNMADSFDLTTTQDGKSKKTRYQNINPGQIMYGNAGEKPHLLSAARPGVTFEPFVKTVKKSIALSVNMPYPVVFKDVEGVNFAGFRSAMLDAWRVFSYRRTLRGNDLCQPVYTMLMEEAWLRGDLQLPDDKFYERMHHLTKAEWRGSPKGDIEPVKAAQADVLLIKNRLKTFAAAIAERDGGDWRNVFEQLDEELDYLADKGILPEDEQLALDANSGDNQDSEDQEDGNQ